MSGSPSTLLREEGNKVYQSACAHGIGQVIQIDRLQRARNLYQRAYDADGTDDDKCSAAKNLALCEWRIGKLQIAKQGRIELIVHNFKEALKNYQYAYIKGNICKDSNWVTDIASKYVECFRDVEKFLSEFSFECRIRYLTSIVQLISVPEVIANVYVQLTQHHFHEGINAWQKGDFMKCKHQMAECHFPMHEARKHGKEQPDILSELEVLENDVHMHMCIAESSKARQTGDELLEKITRYYETIDMNMVWDIIDWYKQSILLARELDMEQEAISLARIGNVYAKVLKFKPQAKEYYKRAIQMAASMAPRTFVACEWYKECTEMLKKYQEETVMHEQEQKDKEKEKVKEEIKGELEGIKEKHLKMTNIQFLKYVYVTYPPKNEAFKLEKDAEENIKKALQKAVTHYHPDRSEPEKNGLKWKVMSEEITKFLTSRYEIQKGIS
ncbi:uncharacterized protein LOC133196411 [Saccostrea echinata]|uniref:uncharacterized protein LOC133196411 n=1 Tax=Saccostrea echinata TaxID=191078 RepID=UPI002A7F8B10|nr:uncharacterized protein LOC133196411 [Saccostrea echinata]